VVKLLQQQKKFVFCCTVSIIVVLNDAGNC